MVLMGDTTTTPTSQPKVVPELQNKSVISVILGDYHSGALTSSGKLLTWGAYSKGALGLGDPVKLTPGTPGGFPNENLRIQAERRGRGQPPGVEIPTEVKFDHGKRKSREKFCFSAAASGWHTGALVIDLEVSGDRFALSWFLFKRLAKPGEEEDDEAEEEAAPETNPDPPHPPPPPFADHGPGGLPFFPLAGGFRFGHAARGIFNRGGRGAGGSTRGQWRGRGTGNSQFGFDDNGADN